MKTKKILVFFMSLILIITVISACTQARRPGDDDNDAPRQTRVVPRRVAPRRVVPPPAPYPDPDDPRLDDNDRVGPDDNMDPDDRLMGDVDDNEEYVDRAEDIAQRVAQLRQVDSATCVITGDTAMVGIQFDKQYKGNVTNEIKRRVEAAVRQEDPGVDRVVVTADPDVFRRLEDILSGIEKGRPISGFAGEINELLNRVQPK